MMFLYDIDFKVNIVSTVLNLTTDSGA